ncbi:galactose oxidase [Synechococcus sp. CCY9202]|uniref:galactose oxidase n=1 Tax=Synechococcus sp. CCY9202 TaxID=174698 RepID=UPI002B1EDB5E|nr:galactose oxidase [Synechococcus sp. CCY9202]
MGVRLRRSALEESGSLEQPIEEWPYLDQEVLVPARSRKVCMTCHWFRHHAGPNCIPLLTCQLHQGLIAQGEHLTSRCQGWTDDMTSQRGWAPEVA